MRIIFALVLFLSGLELPAWAVADDLSYSIGVTAARAMPVQQRTNISITAFEQGLKDGQANVSPKYSDENLSLLWSNYSKQANAAARSNLLSNNKELLSYRMGMSIAKSVQSQKIALDTAVVVRGFSDALKGSPTAITETQISSALKSHAQTMFPQMDSAVLK